MSAGGFAAADVARLERALRARRDAIGRYWLRRVTAVEQPTLCAGRCPAGPAPFPDGTALCFRDLAIERGGARADDVRYTVVAGGQRRWFQAQGPRSCLPLPLLRGEYAVVTIVSRVEGVLARAARVHLSRRSGQRGLAIVGLDRDE